MNLFPLRQSPLDTKPRKPVTMYRMEPEDCYTIGEISKKFHLDDSTVYAHIRKYSIPTRQIGNYVYAHKASIDKLYKDIKLVHVSATIETMGDAYRKLGELLGMEEEAETLATYCDETYAMVKDVAEHVEKANLLYITGDAGLNVIAQGSYHAEIIDLLSNNLAVVDSPSSKGTGNEVDMEQLMLWNPDVILFAPDSVYASVGDDPLWQSLTAIQNGSYYEAPMGPYNWMGFPPSVQRYLGMLWMAKLLYPDAADYDLQAEVTEYFDLFYHCALTGEQYEALMANSIGKQ